MAEDMTKEEAMATFSYSKNTGILLWKIDRPSRVRAGDVAGTLRKDGYLVVKFNQRQYLVHRVIWLINFGFYPDVDIDHINRIRTDNRQSNLRLASRSENCQNAKLSRNNKSGKSGVFWHSQSKKWEANITINGFQKVIGRFNDIQLAIEARVKVEKDVYKFSPLNSGG